MRYGLDLLGLAKMDMKIVLANFPQGWALGAFSNIFGDALPHVKIILDSGKCPRVRINLYFSSNVGHKPDPDYLHRIEAEAIRVGKFYQSYVGKVDCRVCAYCEHPLNLHDADAARQMTMKHMPAGVTYVNSPLGGATLSGCVNETHKGNFQTVTGRTDFSYDGVSVHDSDVTGDKTKHAHCETFYFWIYQFNGHMSGSDKTPIADRHAYPDAKQIQTCVYAVGDLSGSHIPDGWTLKPVSDQHSTPYAGKDQHPVWITPVNAHFPMIEIRSKTGHVISTAPYFGTENEKNPDGSIGKVIGQRYYHPEWGIDICEKLKKAQGNILGQVFADGKRIGDAVLAARLGSFR